MKLMAGTRHAQLLRRSECYDPTVNAGADVFALTAGTAAFESALPSTVRVLGDDFEPADEVTIVVHFVVKLVHGGGGA